MSTADSTIGLRMPPLATGDYQLRTRPSGKACQLRLHTIVLKLVPNRSLGCGCPAVTQNSPDSTIELRVSTADSTRVPTAVTHNSPQIRTSGCGCRPVVTQKSPDSTIRWRMPTRVIGFSFPSSSLTWILSCSCITCSKSQCTQNTQLSWRHVAPYVWLDYQTSPFSPTRVDTLCPALVLPEVRVNACKTQTIMGTGCSCITWCNTQCKTHKLSYHLNLILLLY